MIQSSDLIRATITLASVVTTVSSPLFEVSGPYPIRGRRARKLHEKLAAFQSPLVFFGGRFPSGNSGPFPPRLRSDALTCNIDRFFENVRFVPFEKRLKFQVGRPQISAWVQDVKGIAAERSRQHSRSKESAEKSAHSWRAFTTPLPLKFQ